MSHSDKFKIIKGGNLLTLEHKTRNSGDCQHKNILVEESLASVTCGTCGKELNPIWVLYRLAKDESRFRREREAYLQIKEEIEKRSRTKCEHCRKITRIRGL